MPGLCDAQRMTDPLALTLRWRTDRPGRTLYAQYGNEPGGTDPIIGLMDTANWPRRPCSPTTHYWRSVHFQNGQEVRGGG